jgi:hypothetical protein
MENFKNIFTENMGKSSILFFYVRIVVLEEL